MAGADAFLPTLRIPGLAPASSLRAVARRPAVVSLRAQSYLDDMEKKGGKVQYNERGAPLMPDDDYTVPAHALPTSPPPLPVKPCGGGVERPAAPRVAREGRIPRSPAMTLKGPYRVRFQGAV